MKERMCYVGRKACGCLVTVAVDKPQWKRETAKSVAEWMRDGLTVERMTVADVQAAKLGCIHGDDEKKPKKSAGGEPSPAWQPRLI